MRPSSLRSSRRGSKCEGSGAAPLVSAGRPRILGWLSSRRSRARADEGVNYVRYPHAALVMTPRRLVRSPTLPADSVRAAQRLLEIGEAPLPVQPDAPIPPDVRAALSHTEAAISRVAAALAVVIADLQAGRRPTTARLGVIDDLDQVADDERTGVAEIARSDLLTRQRALRDAAHDVQRRSEERRVGKEGRTGAWRDQLKK